MTPQTTDTWLADRSANTARSYRRALEDWRGWLQSDPARATQRDAAAWAAVMGQTHKPATVAARLAAVSAYHDHLVATGQARVNPFANIRRPTVARYGAAQVLTVAQLRRLQAHLEQPDGPPVGRACRGRALVGLLLHTGRRPAEIAGLRWRDLARDDATGEWLLWWRNGRNLQGQPLPDSCHADLLAWYAAAGWPVTPDAYLWRRLATAQCANLPTVAADIDDNGPITAAQIGAVVRRVGRQVGFDLTPAILRHTYATLYTAVQGDTSELARQLGQTPTAAGSYLRSPALRAPVAEFSAALRALTT